MGNNLAKDLVEYWKIIKKRRSMIIALTFFIVLMVAVHAVIQPKTYESTATIEIGRIDNKILAYPGQLKGMIEPKITSRHNLLNFEMTSPEEDYLLDYNYLTYYNPIIHLKIKVETYNANTGKKAILDIINETLDYTNSILEEYKDMILKEYNKCTLLNNDIEKGIVESGKDSVVLEKYVRMELVNMKLSLNSILLNTKESKVVDGPYIHLKSRNIKMKLLLSLVAGLSFSILLAVIQDELKKH